ncbi:G-type lectin S-receptor-like serine/threonine-protein kinase At2g19130 [Andrographis paniculata]|uniref:G-type lectin S-receptor-like serine/threonine-protein kinase At2g19130 n=1 Tax=Andrographis paniculata TaxID=175694 RepID=UPI0021E9116C|nr:G-type lectin S-receptor-like serine/threonine-protein kinase At2g19130 [Andrographis paniculata]
MTLKKPELFLLILTSSSICHAFLSIGHGEFLSGNRTLSSPNRTFELGFFTPEKSGNYYIGIWYTISLPTKVVVWVANRHHPLKNPAASRLHLRRDGNLVLLSDSGDLIWSTNSNRPPPNSTVAATLLDTGNLVVRNRNPADPSPPLWQSFDYPTDHWLPAGKIGYNKLKGIEQKLRPWRSARNPAASVFSVGVAANGTSHVLTWNDTKLYWSTGEWNGKFFELIPEIVLNFYIKNLRYVENQNERFFTYDPGVPGALTRFLIDSSGQLQQFVWGQGATNWTQFWSRPNPQCLVYALCGEFSSCNDEKPPHCECLPGFEPVDVENWVSEDHTDGCARSRPLQCDGDGGSDTFFVVSRVHLPSDAVVLAVENSEDCRLLCLRNCSCTAQVFDDGQCLHWIGGFRNLRLLPSDDSTGKDVYVKVSGLSEQGSSNGDVRSKSSSVWTIVGSIGGCFCVIVVIVIFVVLKRRRRNPAGPSGEDSLTVFNYRDLRNATRNFSEKLGEGGFGFVYKGTFSNSIVVAVKRLKSVNQGKNHEKQFRAEVTTLGTIQHVNLVRLRGFCTRGSDRFLILDYMANGSLERVLFSKDTDVIDWTTRYKIALGIARGLSYLHEKCRDCIIHCDIKPENILLDDKLNPKISDFGLAKLFGREFSRVLTTVRGTRGYLAPEWLSNEPITTKADVFSYGMLLLEMVSGRRNTGGASSDGSGEFFPAVAASRVSRGDDVMGLLDERLGGRGDVEEVGRVCRVACWCIQDAEKDRPSMGRVVHVFEGLSEAEVCVVPKFLKGFLDDGVELEPAAFVLPATSASPASSSFSF